MSATGKPLQPIIIKRIKKAGHAAHGGAWKIAYADFVTAMMALFLLLWLLGASTEDQRRGIADYFNAPVMVALFGEPGARATITPLPGGGMDLLRPDTPLETRPEQTQEQRNDWALRQALMQYDRQRVEDLRLKIEQAIQANPQLAEMSHQIRLEMVQDGLYIQIVDEQDRPMFAIGSPLVQPHLRAIVREIAVSLAEVPNRMSLSGHTDATPFGRGALGYSNWELSADRANAARRELMAAGIPEQKIARVVGMGPSQPLLPEAPFDPRNRRISILVLTQEAEERMTRSIAGAGVSPLSSVAAPAAPAPTPAATQPPTSPPPQGATLGSVALPPLPSLAPPAPAGR
jgi:chemotaxis protein MotB